MVNTHDLSLSLSLSLSHTYTHRIVQEVNFCMSFQPTSRSTLWLANRAGPQGKSQRDQTGYPLEPAGK